MQFQFDLTKECVIGGHKVIFENEDNVIIVRTAAIYPDEAFFCFTEGNNKLHALKELLYVYQISVDDLSVTDFTLFGEVINFSFDNTCKTSISGADYSGYGETPVEAVTELLINYALLQVN